MTICTTLWLVLHNKKHFETCFILAEQLRSTERSVLPYTLEREYPGYVVAVLFLLVRAKVTILDSRFAEWIWMRSHNLVQSELGRCYRRACSPFNMDSRDDIAVSLPARTLPLLQFSCTFCQW